MNRASWWGRLCATRVWRVPATGLCFVLFGVGGLLISLIALPVPLFTPMAAARRRLLARRFIAWVFRRYLELLRALGLISYEFHNPEALQGPNQLIVANHPSLLDVVFLISRAKEANCVVKGSYWWNPFVAPVVRAAGYLRNDRQNLMQACVEVLAKGESLIIFPEGTRSEPGKPLRLHRGAASIALMSGVGFTPVVVSCHPPALLKNQSWYEVPPQPPHFAFHVQPVMALQDYLMNQPDQSIASRRRLTHDLANIFEASRGARPFHCPADGYPDRWQ